MENYDSGNACIRARASILYFVGIWKSASHPDTQHNNIFSTKNVLLKYRTGQLFNYDSTISNYLYYHNM